MVYDAKHSKGRTVHLSSNTVINRHADGSFNVQLLRPTSEESLTLAARNRSFNSVLPSKRTFRASAVDWRHLWCTTSVAGRRLRKKYSIHGGALRTFQFGLTLPFCKRIETTPIPAASGSLDTLAAVGSGGPYQGANCWNMLRLHASTPRSGNALRARSY